MRPIYFSSLLVVGLTIGATFAHAQSLVREPEATGADALKNVPGFVELLLGNDDNLARIDGAIAACALAVSDPDTAKDMFTTAGWTGQPAEDGETVFADKGDVASFVSITDAGTYCTLTTTYMGTADTQKNFFDVTDGIGWPPFDWKDDGNMGCLQADMDENLHVDITAANGDCASDSDAMITFTLPEGN